MASIEQLGDILDAAERDFIFTHGQRRAAFALMHSSVGEPYDDYRREARIRMAMRGGYWRTIIRENFPPRAHSLRQMVDMQMQQLARAEQKHSAKLKQKNERRERWRAARRDVTPY